MPSLRDAAEWVVKRISALTRTATDADLTDGEYMAVDKSDGYTRKITVASLAGWVLGKIKGLSTTATEADLVAGNYLALDGSAGTKKLPAELIATLSYVYDNFGAKDTADTATGVLFRKEIEISSDADKVFIMVAGQDGLVSSNILNVDFKLNGSVVQTKTINQFDKWFEFQLTSPIDTIDINRLATGIIGSGTLTISILPYTLANKFILDKIQDVTESLERAVRGIGKI